MSRHNRVPDTLHMCITKTIGMLRDHVCAAGRVHFNVLFAARLVLLLQLIYCYSAYHRIPELVSVLEIIDIYENSTNHALRRAKVPLISQT